jgi:gamma-glutamyl hercynylcysteine S-oxide synthase
VLRGGSWATDGLVARASLRRWEHPGRREIFAGFRCARDP